MRAVAELDYILLFGVVQWMSCGRELLFFVWDEVEGDGVHAVAFACGWGAVVEDVAEVAAAFVEDFDAGLSGDRVVFTEDEGVGGDGLPEAGPAGAGVVFLFGAEDGLVAADAVVGAFLGVVEEGSGEGDFCALLAEDVVLLGGEDFFPLGVGFEAGWVEFAGEGLGGVWGGIFGLCWWGLGFGED